MASRPGLSRVLIAQVAGELADKVGLDKLTFSTVADHLGVRTPSLYNHIKGLDGLRRELSILGMNELNKRLQRSALGKSCDNAITSMLQAYRAFAIERPGLYTATLHAPEPDDVQLQLASQEIIDTVMTVLEPYRLNYNDAIHVIRGFRAIGHGFATLELAGAFGIAIETDQSYQRLIFAFLQGIKSISEKELPTE